MKVQTQKINFNGFERIQEVIMRMKLSDASLSDGDISITLEQPIEYGKYDCCWYGGLIATVECGVNEFTIVATGDVTASLIDKLTNEQLAYVKDKANDGRFNDEMCIFIKNDAHLYEIMEDKDQRFTLNIENNNWFEIFYNKSSGAITENSYVCDSSNVFDAIAEAIEIIPRQSQT